MNGYTHTQGALSTGLGHSGRAGEDSEEDYENVENVRKPTSRGSILVEHFATGAFGLNERRTVSDHEYVNTERRKISADVSRSYLRAKGASHYDPQGEGAVGKNYVNVELTPMNTATASIVDSGALCSAKTETLWSLTPNTRRLDRLAVCMRISRPIALKKIASCPHRGKALTGPLSDRTAQPKWQRPSTRRTSKQRGENERFCGRIRLAALRNANQRRFTSKFKLSPKKLSKLRNCLSLSTITTLWFSPAFWSSLLSSASAPEFWPESPSTKPSQLTWTILYNGKRLARSTFLYQGKEVRKSNLENGCRVSPNVTMTVPNTWPLVLGSKKRWFYAEKELGR